jgi:transketolase
MRTPRGFSEPLLDRQDAEELVERARRARGSVLTMTSVAASGHPGGSFSSMEMLLATYHFASIRPHDPGWPQRDRIVISHGHISPGVYAALADVGFFDVEQAERHFRQANSPFEGHVERSVPGVEWDTGNLGQGLSVGVGFALGARMRGIDNHTFVLMSDGEQNKGQVAEARRLAKAQGLSSVTAVVDLNRVQISGHTDAVMPVHVADLWRADGWRVEEADGHDIRAVYAAIAAAVADTSGPVVVLAHTLIGRGVSFMEDDPDFHGRALTDDEYARAMAELGDEPRLDRARARREEPVDLGGTRPAGVDRLVLTQGTPRTYTPDTKVDCRSAWGHALTDLALDNPDTPIAVFDCDLTVSVKTDAFKKAQPSGFIECGVGEHDAAAASGACAAMGVPTFFSDFGVFGIDEVYNQQRLNDINLAGLKLVVTHCGLDVGEDGKTHQCIDYVGALRDFFGWACIVPADANQTDRAVRAAASMETNVCVAMGRSKLPALVDDDGAVLFGDGYAFRYGRIDRIREGADGVVLAMGTPSGAALGAVRSLAAEGRDLAFAVVSSPLELSDDDAEWIATHPIIITVEDHGVRTGLGTTVAEALAGREASPRLVRHGVVRYMPSGSAADLYRLARLDERGIREVVADALDRA